jgi:hypothetical protein
MEEVVSRQLSVISKSGCGPSIGFVLKPGCRELKTDD